MKNSLYKEVDFDKKKFLIYKKKKICFNVIKKKIDNFSKKIKRSNKGLYSITIKNKLEFIILFYALNKRKVPFLINNKNLSKKIKNENLNINFCVKKNCIHKAGIVDNTRFNFSFLLKTSGSTGNPRYVKISNKNFSFVSKNLSKI